MKMIKIKIVSLYRSILLFFRFFFLLKRAKRFKKRWNGLSVPWDQKINENINNILSDFHVYKSDADLMHLFCSKHISDSVQLNWSLLGTDIEGTASLRGITLSTSMLSIITVAPLKWSKLPLLEGWRRIIKKIKKKSCFRRNNSFNLYIYESRKWNWRVLTIVQIIPRCYNKWEGNASNIRNLMCNRSEHPTTRWNRKSVTGRANRFDAIHPILSGLSERYIKISVGNKSCFVWAKWVSLLQIKNASNVYANRFLCIPEFISNR